MKVDERVRSNSGDGWTFHPPPSSFFYGKICGGNELVKENEDGSQEMNFVFCMF